MTLSVLMHPGDEEVDAAPDAAPDAESDEAEATQAQHAANVGLTQAACPGEAERAALAGDPAAWQALIARHQHKVVVALLARGVPIERAKEVAQEAWMRLMQQQRAGRLTGLSLPGLAIVQATFLARSEVRRDSLHRNVVAEVDAQDQAAPLRTGDAEAQLIGREHLRRVEAAFAACPAGARHVFALCYDHPDWSYEQVAKRAHLSVQRVKQIVCETRKRLRAAIEEEP